MVVLLFVLGMLLVSSLPEVEMFCPVVPLLVLDKLVLLVFVLALCSPVPWALLFRSSVGELDAYILFCSG